MQKTATLIQISDCHLFADNNKELAGMNTYQTFMDVLNLIDQQEKNVDHIILTGDISQDDSVDSYRICHQRLARLGVPFIWLRGNHDDMSDITSAMYQNHFQRVTTVGNWAVVSLNSQTPKQVYGELTHDELISLEETLTRYQNHPTLLAIHHPPGFVNSQWLDKNGLRNSENLMTLLRGYPQVQSIIHGHTHQERDVFDQGIRILGTPSTCLQFTPGAESFSLDSCQPGYRSLTLHPNGSLETAVHRLPDGRWLPDNTQDEY